ncbi:twin-arginine translocation signal domain-containing protein, partial [Acetobacter cibinongensis]
MVKSRRNFLRTSGLLACGVALAACTLTKSGNVTSVTLNVAKVDAYAKAAQNFANIILSVPLVTATLGAAPVALINAAATGIVGAIDQINTAANGAATVSYD